MALPAEFVRKLSRPQKYGRHAYRVGGVHATFTPRRRCSPRIIANIRPSRRRRVVRDGALVNPLGTHWRHRSHQSECASTKQSPLMTVTNLTGETGWATLR